MLHHGAASGALGLHCQRLIIQHTQASNLPCLILPTADTTCAPSHPSQKFHCLFVERLHWGLYIIQDMTIMLLKYDVFVV